MREEIRWVSNPHISEDYEKSALFGYSVAETALGYHRSFPSYQPTPLVNLRDTAQLLGLKGLYVKDESYRFGLNAFKSLGGSFCIGKYISRHLGRDIEDMDYEALTSPKTRQALGELTFVTATDGNHGRGIAWTARMLGQKAVVYMPKGSVRERLEHIRALGAQAEITDLTYDEAVQFAAKCQEEYGWILVQDTAWPGYEEIPRWIMQGYTTMALEALQQLGEGQKPTHIFLQAGVGAMAGALTGFFTDYYKSDKPILTIVEPHQADCIFRTAQAGDGQLHHIDGDLNTIMAGLACGTPCTIGWDQLDHFADNFLSLPDQIAAKGMRILGNPAGRDPRVISGESGAVTTGLVAEIMQNPQLAGLRQQLRLDENSILLCFSTEGDTDRDNYRKIVWDGKYPLLETPLPSYGIPTISQTEKEF